MSTVTDDIGDMLKRIDMATYLDRESVDWRPTTGTRGDQLNIRTCPFCGGSEHKVFMNAESGLGNCFHGSCQKKFNKFTFIKQHSGLVGRALITHIEMFLVENGWRPVKKKSETVKISTDALKMPPSIALPYMGKNISYLTNRNITSDIAQFFHLRFCLKGWFKYKLLGEDKFQDYSNRIIIPIFDINGVLVSFQGRDITGKAEKKYLFPPGFAATGAHVFNAHNFNGHDTAVVGEGVFDVFATKIALDQDSNMRNMLPMGTFGKSISADQLKVFAELQAKGLKKVIFLWDSEVQAVDDAIKYGEQIKGLGLEVSIGMLPPEKDPNEVAASVVRETVWRALPLTLANSVKLRLQARKNKELATKARTNANALTEEEKKQLLPNDTN